MSTHTRCRNRDCKNTTRGSTIFECKDCKKLQCDECSRHDFFGRVCINCGGSLYNLGKIG